jgi:hypothetical protein
MVEPRNPPPNMRHALDQPAAPPEKLVKATVARGRSIMVGVGKKLAGFDRDTQKEIWVPICEYRIEGQEVELPESDVIRMRATGFLVDPAAPAPLAPEGPRIVKSEDRDRPSLIEQRYS